MATLTSIGKQKSELEKKLTLPKEVNISKSDKINSDFDSMESSGNFFFVFSDVQNAFFSSFNSANHSSQMLAIMAPLSQVSVIQCLASMKSIPFLKATLKESS